MSDGRWPRQQLLPAATYLDERGVLRWVDDELEEMFPRAKQRSTPPPAEEKLVYKSLHDLNKKYFEIHENLLDPELSQEKREEHLEEASRLKRESALLQHLHSLDLDRDLLKSGNYNTCTELCNLYQGHGEHFNMCKTECGNAYVGNPMAQRGGTKRRKSKRTKKKKTRRKMKRMRKTRKR